jgi:hypothetical protein
MHFFEAVFLFNDALRRKGKGERQKAFRYSQFLQDVWSFWKKKILITTINAQFSSVPLNGNALEN